MNLGLPPLRIENMLESNPLKSGFLVCELTVVHEARIELLNKHILLFW